MPLYLWRSFFTGMRRLKMEDTETGLVSREQQFTHDLSGTLLIENACPWSSSFPRMRIKFGRLISSSSTSYTKKYPETSLTSERNEKS